MIESVVAIVLMAIGLLALIGVVPMALKGSSTRNLHVKASDYSRQQVEILKKSGFDALPSGNYSSQLYHPNGDDRFWQWWSVTEDVGGSASIREVSVSTAWDMNFKMESNEKPSETQTVKIKSYIYR